MSDALARWMAEGLGLPLAQEIAQRHGGLIEFESEPGRTVFMFRLPIDPRTEDVSPEADPYG